MRTMPIIPERLRANVSGALSSVDHQAKVLRGYVVAQAGAFKSKGRGEFDRQSLEGIVALMNASPAGVKSRFAHPTESDDGLGKFLGRARDARLDGDKVRADLHLDPSSFSTPHGDLGSYVLQLAESDPAALSSSLVLRTKKEMRLNPNGTPMLGTDGEPLPPLWRPEKVFASDVVDTGDAVDAILSTEDGGISVDGLPLGVVWRGVEMLDSLFEDQPAAVVRARVSAWLDRYLSLRFGDDAEQPTGTDAAALRRRLRLRELEQKFS